MFFSRTAVAESEDKSIVAPKLKNKTLKFRLISHCLQTIKKSGLPYYIIDENLQKGNSFGEKLYHAFLEVFNMGFSRVIALGNDTPDIQASEILSAAQDLNYSKLVLGKTQTGGIYLIGLHKQTFMGLNFAELPWQSPYLASALCNSAQANHIQVKLLGNKIEINNFSTALCSWSILQKSKLNSILNLILNHIGIASANVFLIPDSLKY